MELRKWVGLAGGVGTGLVAARSLLALRRSFELKDRVALVTGGSRGLGLALARVLLSEGAKVAICARDEAELEEARRQLEAEGGGELFCVPCDVTLRAQVERLIERVRERFGEIDVLVNNAGVTEVGPVESMGVEDFEEAMRTHFYGPLYAALAVIPSMRRRRAGRIVNISSFGGKIAVPHLVPYSASKFALTGLSEGLRAELAADDVYVTTVCPGVLRTGGPRHTFFKGHPLAEYRWFVAGAALPVVAMEPHRAARRIVSALKRGRAELVLTPHARAAVRFKGLFPATTQELLQVVAALLPDAFDGSKERTEGADLEPPRGGTLVDRLQRYWALKFNAYA